MKKFLSLLMAFVMVFMICGSSVPVYAGDFEKAVGVWKLVQMNGDNIMSQEDVEAYEALGVAMYMKLRDNGTAKFSLFGETMEGTWSEYGIVLDNAWLTYILDDGKLIVDNQDGGEMVFARSSMDEIYSILGYQEDVLDEDVKYSSKEKKIVDTKTASVVITGYKADMTGFTVSMRCKNKTGNSIVITGDKCVINKYIFHPDLFVTLEPKESQETEMLISPEEFAMCGITAVDEMILEMSISNAANEKVLQKGIMATVYPTGKKAADIKPVARTPVEGEQVILSNEGCTYLIQGTNESDLRGFAVNCYLENKSNRALNFVWTDVTVDGNAVTTTYEEAVLPGTMGYSDVIFVNDDFYELGIEIGNIATINGKLQVYDKTGKAPALVYEQAFSYTLPVLE